MPDDRFGPAGAEAGQASPPHRRLSRDARRRQLLAAAMPLAARQGLAEFSLEAVSARAGVTRNLLYHYFPRGRPDVVLAVVREAERQLAPVADRRSGQGLEGTLAPMLDHALAPTHAWRIYRLARAAPDPEVRGIADRLVERTVRELAQALGTPAVGRLTQVALRGYVAFAESVLDQARSAGIRREQVAVLLHDTLPAITRRD